MNVVTVKINGQDYTLKGSETEEHLLRVGSEVNKLIAKTLERNSMIDTSSATVLAAINSVDRALKAEDKLEMLKSTEGSVFNDIKVLKDDLDEKSFFIKEYEKENQKLRKKLEDSKEGESEEIKNKEKEIRRLETELKLTIESAKEYRVENESLSKMNKELKFELQSYKYKVLESQKKIFDIELSHAEQLSASGEALKEEKEKADLNKNNKSHNMRNHTKINNGKSKSTNLNK